MMILNLLEMETLIATKLLDPAGIRTQDFLITNQTLALTTKPPLHLWWTTSVGLMFKSKFETQTMTWLHKQAKRYYEAHYMQHLDILWYVQVILNPTESIVEHLP